MPIYLFIPYALLRDVLGLAVDHVVQGLLPACGDLL